MENEAKIFNWKRDLFVIECHMYSPDRSLVYYLCFECAYTKLGEKWRFKRQFLWGIRAGYR